MDNAQFWRIIGLFDWEHEGDDEAVIAPAVDALSEASLDDIAAFEELLGRKLYALDTLAHASNVGEDAYVNKDEHFSVDSFLYARCCVVANGPVFYDTVLNNPAEFPKDVEFEALLGLASAAYERKTGEETEGFDTSVSYETFSNHAGWEAAPATVAKPPPPAFWKFWSRR
jgi:hypothetical protein